MVRRRIALIALSLITASVDTARAQQAAKKLSAAEVAANVDAYYAGISTLTAQFEQRYTNTTFGKEQTSAGKVYLSKPGKMRFDYRVGKRVTKAFIADGKRAWLVDRANKQYAVQPISSAVVPVAVSFLTGNGTLSKDFHVALATGKSYGAKGDYVLELTPKKTSAAYSTLWLAVDPKDFHVRESVVLEASSNVNKFSFAEARADEPIDASTFKVNAKALKRQNYTKMPSQSPASRTRPAP